MKFRKIVTVIMASALMACSLSAVTANAAEVVNADVAKSAQLVNDLDRIIKLRGTMPMKGDINGDKKVTKEDTTVLEVYLKGLININKNSTEETLIISENKSKSTDNDENSSINNKDSSPLIDDNIYLNDKLKDDHYIFIERTKFLKIPYFEFGFTIHFYYP